MKRSSGKNKRTLNESDWAKVFKAKCKSKQGQSVTPEERLLLDAAFKSDPERYGALEAEVFNATVPFGSSAKWGDR